MNAELIGTLANAVLEGRYEHATTILADLDADIPLPLRAEIAAHVAFHTSKLQPTTPLRRIESWFWRALVATTASRRLTGGAIRLSALMLSALGFKQRLRRALEAKWFGQIIHYRYTNFARGLWQSLFLYYLQDGRDKVRRSYLRSLCAHFFGMSGHFDRALSWLAKSTSELTNAASHHPLGYQYFCETLAMQALHMAYAGHHALARETFELLFSHLAQKPYWWIETFARSMRLHIAMETLDEPMLREDAMQLKRLLGSSYQGMYALRTTSYVALIASIAGKRGLSLSQLLESERAYDQTRIPIERGRYHFIRALAELELGDDIQAIKDANRAGGNLAFVPGAIFHAAEANLLDIEISLRLALGSVDTRVTIDTVNLSKRLRRIMRVIHAAPLVAAKVEALDLLLRFVSSGAIEPKKPLPHLISNLAAHSARLALVVTRILGHASGETMHRSPALTDLKHELGLVDLMVRVIDRRHSQHDMEELIRVITGGSSCVMTTRTVTVDEPTTTAIGSFTIVTDELGKLVIGIHAGHFEIEFVITDHLRSIHFDERMRKSVELAAGIIQSTSLNERLAASERRSAIARTTQMVAHDVRKPFSKMLSGLDMIKNARDAERIQAITRQMLPEVEHAIKSVNGMLLDIMEVGSDADAALVGESIDPAVLLQRTLEDVFRTHLDADIEVESELNHERLICVDPIKMQRVFQNIVENAVQAMPEKKGRIWLRTMSQSEPARVVIKLGNAGSAISSEDLPRLFDASFTKGKRGGRGLGLAIVKKFVAQHGGFIICRSEPDFGVEFTIDLPADGQRTGVQPRLATTAAAYRLIIDDLASRPTLRRSDDPPEKVPLSDRLISSLHKRGSPLKILAVDDESIYTDYLRNLVEGEIELAAHVEFVSAASVAEAMQMAREWQPDIAILDIDLGEPECDGYWLSQKMRGQCPGLRVCIHSNRISSKDGAAAVAAGAEAFVPKPMMLAHLVRFIESIVPELPDSGGEVGNDSPSDRPLVALVEDDIFMAEAWEEALGNDTEFITFAEPSAFRRRFDCDGTFRNRLSAIILDNHFEGTPITGTELARDLRGHTRAPILFSSDAALRGDELTAFDAVCGKRPMRWSELNSLIGSSLARPIEQQR